MGMNFYLSKPKCACKGCPCQSNQKRLHIGKSSIGWCFSLHVIPENRINDLEDWVLLFDKSGVVIKNEEGEIVSPSEMLSIITERSHSDFGSSPPGCSSWVEFHKKNYSEFGPGGLLRSKVDGVHCVKHGTGTWDCIVGVFS